MFALSSRIQTGLKTLVLAFLLAFIGYFQGTAHAQTTAPAGSVIENQATVSYFVGALPVTQTSNLVSVTVEAVESLVLTADNTRTAPVGGPVGLPHRLQNTGNVGSNYTLSIANLAGDGYDLQNLVLYRDNNGNGVPDLGEPVINPNTPIFLNPGEFWDLVIIGRVPTSAQIGQVARVTITATSQLQGVTATNTDTITSEPGVVMSIQKGASTTSAVRGGQITYTVDTLSRGGLAPSPMPAIVDGAARNLIVIRDAIPLNTFYVSRQLTANALALFHAPGDPLQTYTTQPGSEVDAVALGLNTFQTPGQVRMIFTVQVNPAASGSFDNVARAYFRVGEDVVTIEAPSNAVRVDVPLLPPTLNYYTSDGYQRIARVTGVGRPLFLQGASAACNGDPTVAERVDITVKSGLTGDSITRTAIETGPNTGVFRVSPEIPTDGAAPNPDDNILQIRKDDVLAARLSGCGTADAIAQILVDPLGIVFDSRTNAPIAGATVTLINVATGLPAQVFQFDGVTPAPSTVTTGPDGAFQFPQVAGGTYRLQIVTPTPFTFPSVVPVGLLPAGRNIDPSGSYGNPFLVSDATGTVTIDVPADAPLGVGLFVDKTASVRDAEIADVLAYSITVRNVSGNDLSAVAVTDALPIGFSYVAGTARLDGAAIAEPGGAATRNLTFAIGTILNNGSRVLTYRVRVGPGTSRGPARNSAQASGTSAFGALSSNVAAATVRIGGGVFTTRGIIIGRVWVDSDHSGEVNNGEIGIPGVRVFLEDGTYAVTDLEGKYSLYGVKSTTHVVKVDTTTLPRGVKLEALSNAHAQSGATAFADMKNGEMQKINFADAAATPAIVSEVEDRRKRGDASASDLIGTVGSFNVGGEGEISAPNAVRNNGPATGTVGGGGIQPSGVFNKPTTALNSASGANITPIPRQSSAQSAPTLGAPAASSVSVPAAGVSPPVSDGTLTFSQTAPGQILPLPNRTAADGPLDGSFARPAAPAASLGDSLAGLDNKVGFVGLKDGDTLASPQINVRVKGIQGAILKLRVNGEEISEKRIGTRSTDAARELMALEYIGVHLEPGQNTLEVAQLDTFGQDRGTVSIRVLAPGRLGRIELILPKNAPGADGRSLIPVKVRLVDDKGTLVSARTPLTLEADCGEFQVKDVNDKDGGIQIFLENGETTLQLLAPGEPGDCHIRISSGSLEANGRLSFVPFLRPVVAAGLVDTQWGFKASGAARIPTEVFESELQRLSGSATGRAAMFLKGQVQGKYLLTMRYDSQDDPDERLFRDIRPDEFYPVYGDSSLKGFDAQSTSKLYVRVDKDRSYALYGDFSTIDTTQGESLGRYGRSLTGGQVHSESDKHAISAFVSRDNTRRIVDELRGNGTSGPYVLTNGTLALQSERVELVVRDRNQPSLVIKTIPQSRFTDYTLDGLVNGVLFKSAVPSFDADFNPIFIRVTYEVEQGGPNFTVAGVSGQFKVGQNLQVGGSVIRDQNPQDKLDMRSVSATYKLAAGTFLIGEWAQTDTSSLGTGSATRLELRHDGEKLQARAFMGRSDANFNNPEALLTQGRSETGARATYKLDDKMRLLGEAIQTKDKTTGAKVSGVQASVERSLSDKVRGQLGVRHSSGNSGATTTSGAGANVDFTSAFARVTAAVTPKSNVFARYEQTLNSTGRSFAVGGDYALTQKTRLYAIHEFFDTPLSLYALNDSERRYGTRFGVETEYAPGASLFSEYRIADGIDGRSSQAAVGLRNNWALGRGVKLNTTLERIASLNRVLGAQIDDTDGTAASVGLESLGSERFKWSARLEGRNGSSSDQLTATGGVALKMSQSLTFLTRGIFARTATGTIANGDRRQTRLQLGMAYRPVKNDRFNALAKWEYRGGDDPDSISSIASRLQRRVQLFSGDANYQPGRSLQMRLHYAWKRSQDSFDGISTNTSAQLLTGRISKDLSRRLNLSLIGSTLWSRETDSRQAGLGLEAGYLLSRDLLFSMGYNFSDLRDRDLIEDNLGRGLYMRLRFKFDEDLLSGIGAFQKPTEAHGDVQPFVPLVDSSGQFAYGSAASTGVDVFSGTPGKLTNGQ